MPSSVDRRAFLAGSTALAATGGASLFFAPSLRAAPAPTRLTVERRVIEVNGKAATVFGIRQPDGTHGLVLDPGTDFRVDLVNAIDDDFVIHWHGQKAPYLQDGVADARRPLLGPGATRSYDYVPTPGTHWMHSHHGLQEQSLMAAPLVVRATADLAADVQDVTVLLHDFTFRDPAEIFAELGGGMSGMGHMGHGAGGMAGMPAMPGMDHAAMGHGTMAMDLNDVQYDAFLANDRTLDDPLVVAVEAKGRVRLRIINGAASSAFWLDIGALTGELVAVDGVPVVPIRGSRFPMAMAQRLDILVDLPSSGAYPVFAQVEGLRERTGFILATPSATVERVSTLSDSEAPPVDLSLENRLRAATPLAPRAADRRIAMDLTGAMAPYVWTLGGMSWPDVDRPTIRLGERIEIEFRNRTMMAHPMHLHGHQFQVVAIDGLELSGAVRDTVLVPVMGSVRIAFDADNTGRWPLHCHNLYHMAAGMMTELVYDQFA